MDTTSENVVTLAPWSDNSAWNPGDAAMMLIDGQPSNHYVLRSRDGDASKTPGAVTYFHAIIKPGAVGLLGCDCFNCSSPEVVTNSMHFRRAQK